MAAIRANRKFSEEQQTFIVQCLATWRTPTEAAELFNERYGWKPTPQSMERYDPTKAASKCGLAQKWVVLFHRTREEFCRETARIGVANLSYRLRELDEMFRWMKVKKNVPLAAQLLKQAAEDARGGLEGLNVDLSQLSDEQLERLAGGEDLRRVLGAKG